MNISSTPFIRNDYWPDYNDINQLNQRINEVENELSLTNIRLSTNIDNVSNDLNSYANNQANTTIANNIIVNNINANYAVGKFVNFGNANFDNAYVENLTVNKPVFDITLNTPHIENVTSLGGNIYDANMFNVNITGGNVAFNSVSIDDLTAVNASISNVDILDGDVNLNKAIIDEAILNKASINTVNILDGNAILDSTSINNAALNIATINAADILSGNVSLNSAVIDSLNASNATISNLFVNTQPEPVTSSAVLGYDSEGRIIPVHASFDVGFPKNANYLFTDEHGTAFAGVAATEVSAVNNLITAQAVQNGFNNLAEEEQIDMNDTFSYLLAKNLVVVDYFNSGSPLNYQYITDVNYNAGRFASPYYLGNNVYMRLNDATLEFSLPALVSDPFYASQRYMYITKDRSMTNAFYNCESLNYNIIIPNGIVYLDGTFEGCRNLNQNILIPNSVHFMQNAFNGCTSLNQNIYIYADSLTYEYRISPLVNTFLDCTLLSDKYIHIRSSIPMDISNNIYNSLVNNVTGINWAGRVINDLEEPTQWPPES